MRSDVGDGRRDRHRAHGRTRDRSGRGAITKVDLFAVGPSPFDEIEFARRKAVVVRVSGETLVLKTPEDTVLRKLLWYREGGEVSEKQWRDVVEVLRVSGGSMDRSYLTEWATRLKLSELLRRADDDAHR